MDGSQTGKLWSSFAASTRYNVIREYKSKRNTVLLLYDRLQQRHLVFKGTDQGRAEMETLRHLAARGVAVPKLIAAAEFPSDIHGFFMEYIPGEPLCDYLERQEQDGASAADQQPILDIWVNWLASFYENMAAAGQRQLGDVNLRNFLVQHDSQRVFGVDFETCPLGSAEGNIGAIVVFLLTYDPSFTPWKYDLARAFLRTAERTWPIDARLVRRAAEAEMAAMALRRSQKFPKRLLMNVFT